MTEPLLFTSRAAFRAWLDQDAGAGDGVWLLLGKPGGPATLTTGERSRRRCASAGSTAG